VSCELLRHQADRTEFVLISVWEDPRGADSHFESPHFKQTLVDTRELLACAPDIRRYGIVKDTPLNA
jgi:quinol monooxygenase YgiN